MYEATPRSREPLSPRPSPWQLLKCVGRLGGAEGSHRFQGMAGAHRLRRRATRQRPHVLWKLTGDEVGNGYVFEHAAQRYPDLL